MKESEQTISSSKQTAFQVSKLTNNFNHELSQKSWFCISLDSKGKTYRQEAETHASFVEIINRSVVTWVDYITTDPLKDLPIVAAQLGFSESLISYLSNTDQLNYQDFDNEMYMKLPSIQIRGSDVQAYPFFILIKENIIFTVHVRLVDKRFIRLRRYSETILRKFPVDIEQIDKLAMLLTRIIDANNDGNFWHLRAIEEFGDELNKDLMGPNTDKSKLGLKIYEMKHALIVYMNSLWESMDVLYAIRYGDAVLITDDEILLSKIGVMVDQIKTQIGLSEHMSNVLASGIEATQTIYNNQLTITNNQLANLNNRFVRIAAFLAIIGTAILIPNTLGTVLGNSVWTYGSTDLWWYLLLFVGITLGGSLLMWLWINKRELFPKDLPIIKTKYTPENFFQNNFCLKQKEKFCCQKFWHLEKLFNNIRMNNKLQLSAILHFD